MICFGIDVSKGKSTVTAISSDGVLEYPTAAINHNAESLAILADRIKSLTLSNDVRVVCESTGYYHWPIANYLLGKGIWVSVLNPIVTNKFSKNSLRNVKTDRVDSKKLATYGLMYWDSLTRSPQFGEIFDELRTYSRQYYQFLALRVKARINLMSILDYTMSKMQTMPSRGIRHCRLLSLSCQKAGIFDKKQALECTNACFIFIVAADYHLTGSGALCHHVSMILPKYSLFILTNVSRFCVAAFRLFCRFVFVIYLYKL